MCNTLMCSSHIFSFEWLNKTELCYIFSLEWLNKTELCYIFSLEWLKLNNNMLRTLPYELVEPILDTVKHIDIHGKYKVSK